MFQHYKVYRLLLDTLSIVFGHGVVISTASLTIFNDAWEIIVRP